MSIGKQALRGVIFVTLSNNIIFLFSFVANNIILARLLSVEAFGQFALATFYVSLVGRLREFGFEYALVHSKEDLKKISGVYITLQILFCFLIVALTLPFSIYIYFSNGYLVALATIMLSVTTAVTNLFNSLNAIYDKQLMFRVSTTISVASTLVSLIGMVVLAYLGYGLWSLVLGGVPGSVLGLYLLFRYLPTKFGWDLDRKMVMWFVNFGPWWHWFISATASLLILQFDNYLVGTIVSTYVLGIYTRAYSWATLPTSRVTAIISKVAFPVYAKLQDSREKLSKAYNLTLTVIVSLALPLSLLSILLIKEGILLLIGEKWIEMVPMFQLLFGYMVLRPIFDDSGALLVAIGKPKIFNTTQLIQAFVMLTLTTLLVFWLGGIGAPIGVGVVMLIGVIYQLRKIRDFVDIDILGVIFSPLLASIVAFIFGYAIKQKILISSSLFLSIVVISLAYALAYILILWLLKGSKILNQLREFKDILKS